MPPTQIHDQQDRLDRRAERRPPHHSSRRRYRDRDRDREREARASERRSRGSNPTPPHQTQTQTHQAQTHTQAQVPAQGQGQGQSRVLPPLRLIPDLRLPAPPPPLRPLRPLQVVSSGSGGGGVDVLDEIARMLHTSRRPLVRIGTDPGGAGSGGFWAPQRRENDVLDDICSMIQMSRGL